MKDRSEKIESIFRSNTIIPHSAQKRRFLKLLCETKDRVTAEQKNNIVYRTDDYTDGQAVRSSRPEVFCENGVPKNLAIFTGKHFYRSLFLIKLHA